MGSVGGAEGTLAARQVDANRADRDAERRGDLGVRVAGVTQEQAGALALRQGGQGSANLIARFGAQHGVGWAEVVVGAPLRIERPVELAGPHGSGSGPPPIAQTVDAQVQDDPPEPGPDDLVWSIQERRASSGVCVGVVRCVLTSVEALALASPCQAQERLLDDVLGLRAVSKQTIGEWDEAWVELPEQIVETLGRAIGRRRGLLGHAQHRRLRSGMGLPPDSGWYVRAVLMP